MKKSLLALAVLGAFAGAAQAQTAVTIYGVVDAGVSRGYGDEAAAFTNSAANNTTAATAGRVGARTFLHSGGSAGSRLGFRGTEDLGNGLSGIFTLEHGFTVDNGGFADTTRMFNRQAFVGLKSNTFGTVSLGRQQNLVRLALLDFDPFALGYAGTSANLLSTYGQRMDNSLKYATPSFGGFTAEVIYGFGERNETDEGQQYEGSLGYANGPIGVKLVHHTSRGITQGGIGGGIPLARTNAIFGSYNFGMAKLALGFMDNDVSGAGTAVTPANATALGLGPTGPGGTTTESRDYLVGLTVPFGPNTLRASYIRKNDRTALEADATQYALSYDYALSKRTSFYTSWARINSDAIPFAVEGTVGNTTDRLFNIGVRHAF